MFNDRPSGDWEEAWRTTEALLAAIREETAAAGSRFLLVHAPTKWEVERDDWNELRERYKLAPSWWGIGTQQRLAEIAERQGIEYLDLRAPLRQAAGAGQRQYFRLDVHWTASGHEVVAGEIAKVVADRALIPTASKRS